MIKVEKKERIRKEYFKRQKSIREIARELHPLWVGRMLLLGGGS